MLSPRAGSAAQFNPLQLRNHSRNCDCGRRMRQPGCRLGNMATPHLGFNSLMRQARTSRYAGSDRSVTSPPCRTVKLSKAEDVLHLARGIGAHNALPNDRPSVCRGHGDDLVLGRLLWNYIEQRPCLPIDPTLTFVYLDPQLRCCGHCTS